MSREKKVKYDSNVRPIMRGSDKILFIDIDFSASMKRETTEKHLKEIQKEFPDRKWVIKRVPFYKNGTTELSRKGYQVFEEVVD